MKRMVITVLMVMALTALASCGGVVVMTPRDLDLADNDVFRQRAVVYVDSVNSIIFRQKNVVTGIIMAAFPNAIIVDRESELFAGTAKSDLFIKVHLTADHEEAYSMVTRDYEISAVTYSATIHAYDNNRRGLYEGTNVQKFDISMFGTTISIEQDRIVETFKPLIHEMRKKMI